MELLKEALKQRHWNVNIKSFNFFNRYQLKLKALKSKMLNHRQNRLEVES